MNKKWLVLGLLTTVNLLNYMERALFAALMPSMQKELGYSDTELGLLGSAFIWSFAAFALLFGWLGDQKARHRVVTIAVWIWSVAAAVTGRMQMFTGQLWARIFVGIGESGFTTVTPALITDFFGKESRAKVFAVYSGAVPVGYAIGYLMGGSLEPIFGWRSCFYFVAAPALLLGFFILFIRDPRAQTTGLAASTDMLISPLKTNFLSTLRRLFKNGGLMMTIAGYATYTFVIGGLSFWMPMYLMRQYQVTAQSANMVFGGVTVVGGVVGTLIGGVWADRLERRKGNGYLRVSLISMCLTVPLFFLILQMPDFTSFSVLLFFLEVALFLCISPLDSAVMSFVLPSHRALAMALNLFVMRCFGDGISRILIGTISDRYGLHAAISFFPWVLILTALIWGVGMLLFWHAVPWPENALRLPFMQAHRGFWKNGKRENTLEALQEASASGAEMTEFDVQVTKDKEAVLFHDADLKRICGLDKKVADLTAVEMLETAGAPRLLDVLLDKKVPTYLNIELKTREFKVDDLEQAVSRAVKQAQAEHRVLFSSFNPFSLRKMAFLLPDVPRALLVSEEVHPDNKIYLRRMWLGLFSRPHMLNLDHEMITGQRMLTWTERNLPIAAWTVNTPQRAQELRQLNLKSIISDTLFVKQDST